MIDPGPPPELNPVDGCLPLEEELALVRWMAREAEERLALAVCPLVRRP